MMPARKPGAPASWPPFGWAPPLAHSRSAGLVRRVGYRRARAVEACLACGDPLASQTGMPRVMCRGCTRALQELDALGRDRPCRECGDRVPDGWYDDEALCRSCIGRAPVGRPHVPLWAGEGVVYDGGPFRRRIIGAAGCLKCGGQTRTEGNGLRSCLNGHVTRIHDTRLGGEGGTP